MPQLLYKDQALQKQDEPHPAKGQGEAWCLDNEVDVEFCQNENSQEPGLTCAFGLNLANLCAIFSFQQHQNQICWKRYTHEWIPLFCCLQIFMCISNSETFMCIWFQIKKTKLWPYDLDFADRVKPMVYIEYGVQIFDELALAHACSLEPCTPGRTFISWHSRGSWTRPPRHGHGYLQQRNTHNIPWSSPFCYTACTYECAHLF